MRIDFGTPTKGGETVSILFLPSASMLLVVAGETVYPVLFEEKIAAAIPRAEADRLFEEVSGLRFQKGKVG